MEITEVRLRRAPGKGRVRALASVTFDDALVVHGIQVVEGPSGLFVAMPARRTMKGDYRDIAHPVTAEARERLQRVVLEAFAAWSGREDGEAVASA